MGRSACDVIAGHDGSFRCKTLVFGRNVNTALKQIEVLAPEYVGCILPEHAELITRKFPFIKEVFSGEAIYEAAAVDCDTVVSAVSGSAGARFSFAALGNASRIALANKETVVMGGNCFMDLARAGSTEIIPVDSEHCAIHQCLGSSSREEVRSLILTASGGAFRDMAPSDLASVTPDQALVNPNWDMGAKITVDSASLVNKGLELMEASFLFGIPGDSIRTLMHRQSIIHSMVEFVDGSVTAQLSVPDMRLPILYALTYPRREYASLERLDLAAVSRLDFGEIDHASFPGIRLARLALQGGDASRIAFNRVNEECVYAFLEKRIGFTDIYAYLEKYLDKYSAMTENAGCYDDIVKMDEMVYHEIKGELIGL